MLRERLQAVFEFIDECECLIDIGTDHAYIPIECVESGKAKRAVAADINVGPVRIADKNIDKYGMKELIQTAVSDGFENLGLVEADAVVIAGMGGTLISEILARGFVICPERFKAFKQIVLQPMNDIEDLRRWLKPNGFEIVEERLVAEGTKIYCMMKVVYAGERGIELGMEYDEKTNDSDSKTIDFLLGGLKDNRDELMLRFVDKMIKRRKRILSGYEQSKKAHGGELTTGLSIESKRIETELSLLEDWVNG